MSELERNHESEQNHKSEQNYESEQNQSTEFDSLEVDKRLNRLHDENEDSGMGEDTVYSEQKVVHTDNEASTDIEEENGSDTVMREIFSWVKIILGAFIVAFLVSNFVILNARVPTGSMISTINKGDKVIGFRLAYTFSEPKRGDIVMFNSPVEDKIYIKRIIGLPGDHITITDNQLYINGELYEEDYVDSWHNSIGTTEYDVPKGEYFMMGDNRDGSSDSRGDSSRQPWTVKRKEILAKAIFRYYPSIGLLD